MSIAVRQVNPEGTRVFMATLTDKVDLHSALLEIAIRHDIQTATVDFLGGLHSATFVAYNFVTQSRQPAQTLMGALEVVAGHGTLASLNGELQWHIHALVAQHNSSGQMTGGHLQAAEVFAIEATIYAHAGPPVTRKTDPGSGLNLWDLTVLDS